MKRGQLWLRFLLNLVDFDLVRLMGKSLEDISMEVFLRIAGDESLGELYEATLGGEDVSHLDFKAVSLVKSIYKTQVAKMRDQMALSPAELGIGRAHRQGFYSVTFIIGENIIHISHL